MTQKYIHRRGNVETKENREGERESDRDRERNGFLNYIFAFSAALLLWL